MYLDPYLSPHEKSFLPSVRSVCDSGSIIPEEAEDSRRDSQVGFFHQAIWTGSHWQDLVHEKSNQ